MAVFTARREVGGRIGSTGGFLLSRRTKRNGIKIRDVIEVEEYPKR